MEQTVTASILLAHINSGIRLSNLELDLRADLVMCFDYNIEDVAAMPMDNVYRILDEADEEENYPDKYKNRFGIKCTKCGCEVGFIFNDHSDMNDSICRCGHVDSYSEYYFDNLAEAQEFKNAMNPTVKKLYSNLKHFSVLSQRNNAEQVSHIRENGYLIQQFETDDNHEFYKLGDEYMYFRTSIHGTEVMKMVFNEAK